jgi:hypothetical protein
MADRVETRTFGCASLLATLRAAGAIVACTSSEQSSLTCCTTAFPRKGVDEAHDLLALKAAVDAYLLLEVVEVELQESEDGGRESEAGGRESEARTSKGSFRGGLWGEYFIMRGRERDKRIEPLVLDAKN